MKIHLGKTAHTYTIQEKKRKLYRIPKTLKNFKTDMYGNYETENVNLINYLTKQGYKEVKEKKTTKKKSTKKED